jgi:hypothetical protein
MSSGALLFVIGAALLQPGAPASGQSSGAPDCTDWRECRQMVEAALETGELEHVQDLAWRAVQRGPKDDPELMFLLARAQSRSGRPHDALVMIRRLAERSVRTAADTHPDLERMRELPGWPDAEGLVVRANAGEPAAPAPTPPADAAPKGKPGRAGSADPSSSPVPAEVASGTIVPSSASGTSVPRSTLSTSVPPSAPGTSDSPVGAAEALRFTGSHFVAAGLAYDAVSHRFVIGDRDRRKLQVVGVGLDHAVDLVRAESAGFHDVHALEIDTRRGDLWVVSANPTGSAGALHRLQLVSGRPLQAVTFDGDLLPLWPVDLAVTGSGGVIVLDREGRLLRLRPGGTAAESLMPLNLEAATSLAVSGENVLFVASRAGLSRVDLASKAITAVAAPADVSLEGFERLRVYRSGLVGLQTDAAGTRRIVRLDLTANGRRVRKATRFDLRFEAAAGPIAFAVSGDEVSLIAGGPDPSGSAAAPSSAGTPAELTVHRLRLR